MVIICQTGVQVAVWAGGDWHFRWYPSMPPLIVDDCHYPCADVECSIEPFQRFSTNFTISSHPWGVIMPRLYGEYILPFMLYWSVQFDLLYCKVGCTGVVVSLQNVLVIRCQVIDKLSGNLRPQFLNAPSSYCAFRSENTSLRINVSRCQGIEVSGSVRSVTVLTSAKVNNLFKFRARGFQISSEKCKKGQNGHFKGWKWYFSSRQNG